MRGHGRQRAELELAHVGGQHILPVGVQVLLARAGDGHGKFRLELQVRAAQHGVFFGKDAFKDAGRRVEAGILRVVGVAKEYDDGRRAILFGGGDEALAGHGRVAGLDADGVFVQAAFRVGRERVDEFVGVFERQGRGVQVGCVNRVGARGDDAAELFVLQRVGGEPRHVARGGVVVVVVYAMGVHKMGAGHAELGGLAVHAVGERLDGAGRVAGDGGRRVVARDEHEPVEQVAQADRLADLQPHERAVLGKALLDLFAHGDLRVQIFAAFKRQDARHNLRGAGRVGALVRGALIEHLAGVVPVGHDHLGGGNGAVIVFGKRGGRQRERQRRRQQHAEKSFFHVVLPSCPKPDRIRYFSIATSR